MSAQRYTEKFKVKAVNQVLDRGHWVAEVAQRLSDATLSSLALRARNVFTPCLHPFPQPLPRFYPPFPNVAVHAGPVTGASVHAASGPSQAPVRRAARHPKQQGKGPCKPSCFHRAPPSSVALSSAPPF
ncbi:transposase [Ralstonia nicotianae]|uniref:transposase n=1 Tax=Ralstonia pseudosolanacearum TaxID=1310165 RepID=UPI00397B1D9A